VGGDLQYLHGNVGRFNFFFNYTRLAEDIKGEKKNLSDTNCVLSQNMLLLVLGSLLLVEFCFAKFVKWPLVRNHIAVITSHT